MSGWIKLHRSIKEHWLYEEKRKFSKLEAWIDILLTVNFKKGKTIIKGKLIEINRGESIISLDSWAKRWNWDKSAVRRFLDVLQKENAVVIKNETVTTRLTVCNYDSYQDMRNADETQMKRIRNADETQMTPIEEEKEKQEEKETKCVHEKIFDFEKVWYSFQGKKNTYEKDLKNFNLKTYGLDIDFEKLFYEAKKSKNIYFQNWINDLFPKYTKKVAQKKEKEIKPDLDTFIDYARLVYQNELKIDFSPFIFAVTSKFNDWNDSGWNDGNGKPILSWKNKLRNSIPYFKPINNNSHGNTKTPTNQFNSNQSKTRTGRQILAERLINSTKANGESGSTIIDVEAL